MFKNVVSTRARLNVSAKRLVALLAIVAAAVAGGVRNAEAVTNPFAVGDTDSLICNANTPTLHLSIENTGALPTSQYSSQWTNPTLDVGYLAADGTTYYPFVKVPLPSIAPGNETTLEIPVERADITYKIAVLATDPTGKSITLLKVTTLTPADFCPTPLPFLKPVVSNPIAQGTTSNLNAAAIAKYLSDTPTNVTFPQTQACFKLVATAKSETCVENNGAGLLIAWEYDFQQADGFRIYRVDNGAHTYLTSVSRKLNVFAAVLPAPKTGDFSGQCFAVVAVSNGKETNASPSKCATASDSLQQATILPDRAISYCYYSEEGNHSDLKGGWAATGIGNVTINCNYHYAQNPVGPPYSLGYLYDTNPGIQDSRENLFERFGAHFNLAKYAGHNVISATYELDVKSSVVDFHPYTSGGCAQEAAPAGNDWFSGGHYSSLNNADFTHASKFNGLVSGKAYSSSLAQTVDITKLVQTWIDQPSANHGLIVRNQDENPAVYETQRSCFSVIDGSSKLHLTYR